MFSAVGTSPAKTSSSFNIRCEKGRLTVSSKIPSSCSISMIFPVWRSTGRPDLLERTASEVMTANPKTVAASTLAAEAVAVMNNSAPKVTSLFVVEGREGAGRPVGFLTIHDCLRAGVQ